MLFHGVIGFKFCLTAWFNFKENLQKIKGFSKRYERNDFTH